jgi:hypothetical protein
MKHAVEMGKCPIFISIGYSFRKLMAGGIDRQTDRQTGRKAA